MFPEMKLEKVDLPVDVLKSVRDLYYYDGPLSYITKDNDGNDYLLYICDTYYNPPDPTTDRYFVIKLTEGLEEKLVSGELDIRTVLLQPEMFFADMSGDSVVFYKILDHKEAEIYIPEPGVNLYNK